MIHRDSTEYIKSITPTMPVLCILGPRQAGKTTLARYCFPLFNYVSCDDRETAASINANPKAFLESILATEPGVIIDEFQRCPDILPAIKVYADNTNSHGRIVLSGSQNYLIMATISQSLAGLVWFVDLLPLSINELSQAKLLPAQIHEFVFKGSYPRLYVQPTPLKNVSLEGYLRTYLERDVRSIHNVPDLSAFHTFIKLCANRIGQLLNLNSLALDAKISVDTAKQWISLLEASYIIYLLQPHHKNFNKTLTKSPKLYFTDTGLATHLLEISSTEALEQHSMRGSLFENLAITECIKWHQGKNRSAHLYFWRDAEGHEIDLVISHAEKLIPVEIKSANAARNTMTDELVFWHNLTGHPLEDSYVIYTGTKSQSEKGPQFVPWEGIPAWLTKLLEQ